MGTHFLIPLITWLLILQTGFAFVSPFTSFGSSFDFGSLAPVSGPESATASTPPDSSNVFSGFTSFPGFSFEPTTTAVPMPPELNGLSSLASFADGQSSALNQFSQDLASEASPAELTEEQKESATELALEDIPEEGVFSELELEFDDVDCTDQAKIDEIVAELQKELCDDGEDCISYEAVCGSVTLVLKVQISRGRCRSILLLAITREDVEDFGFSSVQSLRRFAFILARYLEAILTVLTGSRVRVSAFVFASAPSPPPPLPSPPPPSPLPSPPPRSPSPPPPSPILSPPPPSLPPPSPSPPPPSPILPPPSPSPPPPVPRISPPNPPSPPPPSPSPLPPSPPLLSPPPPPSPSPPSPSPPIPSPSPPSPPPPSPSPPPPTPPIDPPSPSPPSPSPPIPSPSPPSPPPPRPSPPSPSPIPSPSPPSPPPPSPSPPPPTPSIDSPSPSPPSPPPPSPSPPPSPPPPSPSSCYVGSNYIDEQCPDSTYDNIAPECACDPNPSTSIQPSIIGGENIRSTDYAFIVNLQSQRSSNCFFSFCGASLLAPNLVLTAAHCVDSRDPSNPGFFVAQAPRCRHEGGLARVAATSIIIHEQYNQNYFLENDIALIFLEENLPGPTVDISASADVTLVTGTKLGLVGYGVSENPTGGGYEKVALQGAFNIDYKSGADCASSIDDTQICTETFPFVNNACYGDSGGPLLYLKGTRPVQVGITSFVRNRDSTRSGCFQGNGGYARVSSYLTWITTNSGMDFGTSTPLPSAPAPPSPPPPPPVPASMSDTDMELLSFINNFRNSQCAGTPSLSWNFMLALEASVLVNRCVAVNFYSYSDASFIYFNNQLPASSTPTEVFTAALSEVNQDFIGEIYSLMLRTSSSDAVGCAVKTDCSQRFDEDFVHLVCIFNAELTAVHNPC